MLSLLLIYREWHLSQDCKNRRRSFFFCSQFTDNKVTDTVMKAQFSSSVHVHNSSLSFIIQFTVPLELWSCSSKIVQNKTYSLMISIRFLLCKWPQRRRRRNSAAVIPWQEMGQNMATGSRNPSVTAALIVSCQINSTRPHWLTEWVGMNKFPEYSQSVNKMQNYIFVIRGQCSRWKDLHI